MTATADPWFQRIAAGAGLSTSSALHAAVVRGEGIVGGTLNAHSSGLIDCRTPQCAAEDTGGAVGADRYHVARNALKAGGGIG